jgi:hypothetical protein
VFYLPPVKQPHRPIMIAIAMDVPLIEYRLSGWFS